MPTATLRFVPLVLLAIVVVGCSKTTTAPTAGGDEDQVRKAFVEFQEALKAKDAEKVWGLLDDDSRADAERVATMIRDNYAKATPAEKADQEKALGLPGAELAALKGIGFLKTKRFLGKYDEVAESKVTKVSAQGEKGTVEYTEPDGDHEKFGLFRQGGQWKLTVPMPRPN